MSLLIAALRLMYGIVIRSDQIRSGSLEMDGWIDGWFVIMNALIFIARAEDAARSRARTHNRSTAARSDIVRSNHHVEKFQRKKGFFLYIAV